MLRGGVFVTGNGGGARGVQGKEGILAEHWARAWGALGEEVQRGRFWGSAGEWTYWEKTCP